MKKFYRRFSIAVGYGETTVFSQREFVCPDCNRKEEVKKTRENITTASLIRLDRLFNQNPDNIRIFHSFYNNSAHVSMSNYG